MTVAKTSWCRRDRDRFLACLAASGEPKRAAETVGRTLEAAFLLRETDRDFAESWARAVAIAWELVEARVLARLLAPEDDLPAAARILDSKLALAVLQRRSVNVPAAVGEPAEMRDSEAGHNDDLAQLRREIRQLAEESGEDFGHGAPGLSENLKG